MTLAALVAAAAVLLALAPQARALDCEGVDLDDGCLFTITGGDTTEPNDGFAVTNVGGVPMWDFVRDKDAQAIGYPISQRWVDGPFTLQAFQKVILQWDPGKQRMNFYNTLDTLANRYPDIELPFVPAHQVLDADRGADFRTITQNHLALLEQNAAIKERFLSEPDWLNLYGLPIRYEESEVDGQAGAVQMLRAQRTVFVVWNVPAPGTTVGRVNLQNVPDKVKRLSNVIIPDGAKAPVTRDGRINAAIEQIAWVQDGLSHGEAHRVEQLRELATLSPTAFWALVRNPGIHTSSVLSRDLEPTRTVGEIIGRTFLIARGDPLAAEKITAMPFLDTFDGLDLLPLWTAFKILWFAPDELESTLSHLALVGGLTEDQTTSLALIHLKLRHPEAGQAIEALPWIQDGISPPPRSRDGSPVRDDDEASIVIQMMEWQLRGYRSHLLTLLSRPWFRDGLDRREYEIVFTMMSNIAPNDSEASLRILKMPFLETIGEGDLLTADILYSAAFDNDLQNLLSQPALRNGIVDGQLWTVALEHLRLRDSSAAAALASLPWIRDGVSTPELTPALALYTLALDAQLVLRAVLDNSWLRDSISPDELSVIVDLRYIGNKDEALALRITQMPFLDMIGAADAAATGWLATFSDQHRRSYLDRVLSHPTLSGGIKDEHAAVVAALLDGAEFAASAAFGDGLLTTVLDPEHVVVEQRVVTLPLAGDVILAVVRTRDSAANSMQLLERAVRSHEEFMAASLPVAYVSMLVADVGRSGVSGGFIHINVSSYSDFTAVIAHEAAHFYWAYPPRWMQEGGATFLEWIALNKVTPENVFRIGVDSCSSARSLSELEQKTPSVISGRSICHYDMGFGLFYDLYNSLGDAEFRRGFRELFLKLLAQPFDFSRIEGLYGRLDRDPSEPECTGMEASRCFLRAAFVAAVPDPTVSAIASEVIDRWYYGPQGATP